MTLRKDEARNSEAHFSHFIFARYGSAVGELRPTVRGGPCVRFPAHTHGLDRFTSVRLSCSRNKIETSIIAILMKKLLNESYY